MTERGCLYVAFGRPYLIQALHSVRTLRRVNPDVGACIVTNVLPGPPPAFGEWDPGRDTWRYIDRPTTDNRLIKTDLLRYTPFQRTLFLDCDTEVLADLAPTFAFLDHWDIAVRLKEEGYAPLKEKGRQVVLDGAARIHELPHWNSGVFLFDRNDRVAEFYDLWHRYFQSAGVRTDQVSLVEAMFRSSCRVLSLDARWNATADWGVEHPEQRRIILHYMHGIDDRLANDLLALDHIVFPPGAPTQDLNGDLDTASYLQKRHRTHVALTERPTFFVRGVRKVKAMVRRLLRSAR